MFISKLFRFSSCLSMEATSTNFCCCSLLVNIFIVELQERDMTFAAEQDVEYELEEVWDGAQWHVVHKLLPKKTDSGSV